MDLCIISFNLKCIMQLKQFYNIATKVSFRKKCYYFWWSIWLLMGCIYEGLDTGRLEQDNLAVNENQCVAAIGWRYKPSVAMKCTLNRDIALAIFLSKKSRHRCPIIIQTNKEIFVLRVHNILLAYPCLLRRYAFLKSELKKCSWNWIAISSDFSFDHKRKWYDKY